MIAPGIQTWIEKRHILIRIGVSHAHRISFSSVAVETRQRQVVESICPALGKGDDMVQRKPDVLPLLCCVAILTQGVRPLTDLLPDRFWNFTAKRQRL